MPGGDLPGEGEPEPDALGLARRERLEQRLGEPRWRSRPGVADLDGDRSTVVDGFESHRPAVPRGLNGVQGQIQGGSPEPRFVGRHFEGCPIAPEVERDLRVLARGADEEGDVAEEPPEVAHRRRPALDAAEREEPLDLLLGHGELPQCDVQAPVSRRGGEPPRVQLDAHPRPREGIPHLVGEARRELGEESRPLRLLDGPAHVPQLVAHRIDGTGEVRDLVSLATGVEPFEVAPGDAGHLEADDADPSADAVGDPARDRHHEHERAPPEYQGRCRGLSPRLPPTGLGVEDQERRRVRMTRRRERHCEVADAVQADRRRLAERVEAGRLRDGTERRGLVLEARKARLRDPPLGRIGDELSPGEATHPGKDAPRVRKVRVPEGLDDAVQAVDDLAFAPPCGEGRRGQRDGTDRHTLDDDEGNQDLISYRPTQSESPGRTGPAWTTNRRTRR